MKAKVMLIAAWVLVLVVVAGAGDWSGKAAIGIRGPIFVPYDDIWGPEPYLMGFDGNLFLKYGLSKSFVFDISLGYATTYDDTTSDLEDKNTSFSSKDKAVSKLSGFLLGLTGSYYFIPEKRVQPYLFAGIGIDMWKIKMVRDYQTFPEDSKYNFTDFDGKGGLGLNIWLAERVAMDLRLAGTYALSNLSGDEASPLGNLTDFKLRAFRGYLEPSVGLSVKLGKARDSDKDGVPDNTDNCPDTPLGASVDDVGCPFDADGDGVYDGIDECPNTPKGAIVDITGCPLDTDKDGVFDGLDKCPNTPRGAKVDDVGCPLDGDNDGVPDGIDKCPETPPGCLVDATGCKMDSDNDGVCDGLDKCPTTPAGTQVDQNGCPVEVKPPVQKITLHITYATGSFEPDSKARATLDELIKTMLAYTGTKIQINGYTDDVGPDAFNMELSRKRANGVMEYLLKGGVEADRMSANGYGENPAYFVGDNATPEGRQQNRRVEIISIEQ
jgi:outer membrane protein OmpA-like peptidoglycan-associated protein